MKRDDVLNLRVPGDLKDALRKAAAQDERSLSMLAVRILRDWLTSKGFYDVQDTVRRFHRTRKTPLSIRKR